MKLISHRGNLEGPNPERENHPDYIYEAIQAGYDVEIDIWFVDGKSQLNNLDSNGSKLNYFFHESDLGVLTSKGYIWSTNQCERAILVMPETFNQETNENTFGVCSDYIKNYG